MYVKYQNEQWEKAVPMVSVITPIYNRSHTIKRTIESVRKQSFQNIEYIIVDDGSTDELDDVLMPELEKLDIPVLYMKKENGGVHTACNLAVSKARGKYTRFLDSDDEMTDDSIESFLKVWDHIPASPDLPYREVVAQCKDQNGKRVGEPFPDNINELPWKDAIVACDMTHGEHTGMNLTKALQEYPWPEPEEITLVSEDIVWKKMEKSYRSYYINDMLRIYHMDTEGSYSNTKKSLQYCRNTQWNLGYCLDHWDIYKSSKNNLLKDLLLYEVFTTILVRHRIKPYQLSVRKYSMLRLLERLPGKILACWYMKKRLVQKQ